jgi:hypothetical protein
MGDNIRPKPSYNIGQEPLEAIRDTKVSVNSTDEPGYLESKIDNNTIKVVTIGGKKKIVASSEGIGVPVYHNLFPDLQGGVTDNYYHLTSAQYTIATQAAAVNKAGYVNLLAQTFTGIKTFVDSPVIPDATSTKEAAAYGQVVNLTAAQTVAGIKTFSSFPITPESAPTTDYQVGNKKYIDDLLATTVKLTGNQLVSGVKTLDSFPIKFSDSDPLNLIPSQDDQFTTKYYVDAKTYAHNDTTSKQGGASNDYYHLTQVQHTIATQAASATVAGHITTGAQTIAGAKTFSSNPISTAAQLNSPDALVKKSYLDGLTIDIATNHNVLTNLQGGQSSQYYHLSSAQHGILTSRNFIYVYDFADLNIATKAALVEAGNWSEGGTGNVGTIDVGVLGGVVLSVGMYIVNISSGYTYTVYKIVFDEESPFAKLIRVPINPA